MHFPIQVSGTRRIQQPIGRVYRWFVKAPEKEKRHEHIVALQIALPWSTAKPLWTRHQIFVLALKIQMSVLDIHV